MHLLLFFKCLSIFVHIFLCFNPNFSSSYCSFCVSIISSLCFICLSSLTRVYWGSSYAAASCLLFLLLLLCLVSFLGLYLTLHNLTLLPVMFGIIRRSFLFHCYAKGNLMCCHQLPSPLYSPSPSVPTKRPPAAVFPLTLKFYALNIIHNVSWDRP